jgi:hypothetical protein
MLDILTMNLPINVKSHNNISKLQMGFNSAFKGLIFVRKLNVSIKYIRIQEMYFICISNNSYEP